MERERLVWVSGVLEFVAGALEEVADGLEDAELRQVVVRAGDAVRCAMWAVWGAVCCDGR